MTKISDKKKLSSDAKVILVLMKRQPLAFQDLYKRAKIHEKTLYRLLRLLLDRGIIKEVSERKYALSDYTTLEETFIKLKKKYSALKEVSLDDLAYDVGKPPEDIRQKAYELAKKHGLRIACKTTHKGKRLVDIFS